LDMQPGLTAEAAGQLLLSRAASGAKLLRPVNLVVLRQEAGDRLGYTSVGAPAVPTGGGGGGGARCFASSSMPSPVLNCCVIPRFRPSPRSAPDVGSWETRKKYRRVSRAVCTSRTMTCARRCS